MSTMPEIPCPLRLPAPIDGIDLPHKANWDAARGWLSCLRCEWSGTAAEVRLAILDQMRAFEAATYGAFVEPVDESDMRPMRHLVAVIVDHGLPLGIALDLAEAYDTRRAHPVGRVAIERLFRAEIESAG